MRGWIKWTGSFGAGMTTAVILMLVWASLFGAPANPLLGTFQGTVTHNGQAIQNIYAHNVLTAAGILGLVRQNAVGASGAAAAGNGTVFMQLSTNTTTPNGSETTCAGSLSSNGLDPAVGTYAAITNGYNLSHTWTYTGSSATVIARICIWDGNPSTAALWSIVEWSASATVTGSGDTFGGNYSVTFSG